MLMMAGRKSNRLITDTHVLGHRYVEGKSPWQHVLQVRLRIRRACGPSFSEG
jgi:hypothetical protein